MRNSSLGLVVTALGLAASGSASAHEGRLDENGCHYDRAKGNTYHCHQDVAPNTNRNAPVKKSRENICHDAKSPNYRTLRKFVAYRSMAACITSGGQEALNSR
jgi:hypothetical protein